MKKIEIQYFNYLKKRIREKIQKAINEKTISFIVENDLSFHIQDKVSSDFHKYYFESLNNKQFYLNSNNFFKVFKKKYLLQGIDNKYLETLENQKSEIYNLIENNRLTELYIRYFASAQITQKEKKTQKEKVVIRNLGSFFTKFVHTFKPNEYCALDNPIKKYFGLKNESFFISFITISQVYKEWIKDNEKIVTKIRQKLEQVEPNNILSNPKLSDMKILDLIFWKKANKN